jgi:hypothetical protein
LTKHNLEFRKPVVSGGQSSKWTITTTKTSAKERKEIGRRGGKEERGDDS